MLTFSSPKMFPSILKKRKKEKRFFLSEHQYQVQPVSEIREQISKLSSCPKCHFLIFDNYWTDDIENKTGKLCPTCGFKLSQ